MLALGMATTATAQEKGYSYTAYYSYGTASGCSGINVAYVSPIVSHTFEYYLDRSYVDSRDYDNKSGDLERKWSKKCKAKFNIDKTYCFGHGPDIWYESRSEADEERDEEIAYLKRQGYTVYDSFSFGFYFD